MQVISCLIFISCSIYRLIVWLVVNHDELGAILIGFCACININGNLLLFCIDLDVYLQLKPMPTCLLVHYGHKYHY